MTTEHRIVEQTEIVETIIKSSETKSQVTFMTREPLRPEVVKAISVIYDSQTKQTEVIEEKEVQVVRNVVPKI